MNRNEEKEVKEKERNLGVALLPSILNPFVHVSSQVSPLSPQLVQAQGCVDWMKSEESVLSTNATMFPSASPTGSSLTHMFREGPDKKLNSERSLFSIEM